MYPSLINVWGSQPLRRSFRSSSNLSSLSLRGRGGGRGRGLRDEPKERLRGRLYGGEEKISNFKIMRLVSLKEVLFYLLRIAFGLSVLSVAQLLGYLLVCHCL